MCLETSRLLLRRWRPEDREPFARLNADPRVMEYLSGPIRREDSDSMVDRCEAQHERRGFGLWAAELREGGEFIGYIGLAVPNFQASFTPCVEVGWRLAAEYWGRGLATEGAGAAVRFGFTCLQLPEIVSFTVPRNVRSRRVMERLGMRFAGEFDYPRLPAGHPLRRHVLYRLQRAEWLHRNALPQEPSDHP